MNTKQLIALSALALAGTTALAGEITIVNETFVPVRSRAEVRAEVLNARAAGITQFVTEAGAVTLPAAAAPQATLTREQVRAELRNAPRAKVMTINPAA